MNHPAVDMSDFPVQLHTISLEDAMQRTAVWRSSISKLFPSGPEDAANDLPYALVPKAIHIDIKDITQLANDYSQAGIFITGVRLYFTLENNNIDNGYHVKGILVPTIKSLTIIDKDDDVIMPVPIPGTGDDAMGVSIYDFTRPCPTYCGGTSPELAGEATSKKNVLVK